MKSVLALIVGLTLSLSQASFGQPIIEQRGRLTIDWSNLTLKYYGKSAVPKGAEESFTVAEKAAWQEGIQYARGAIRDYHLEKYQVSEEKKKETSDLVADRASKNTRSVNTVYAANGEVRIDFESPLAVAVADAAQTIAEATAPSISGAKNTGLVLQITGGIQPSADYVIKDENEQILYQAKDVTPSAYGKNLMGRWFKTSLGPDAVKSLGENPVTLTGSAEGQTIHVKRSDWDQGLEGNRAILEAAKIAVLIQ